MPRYPAFPPSLLACLLMGCLALQAARAGEAPVAVAIYGDDAYPPYSYLENGRMKGIYASIIRQALKRMPEYEVTLLPIPWKRGLVLLETGAAFALYPPYLRPDERPYMSYSEPLIAEQLVVLCTQAVSQRHALKTWPDDYLGLRIGINAGFLSGGKRFDQAVHDGRLRAEPARSSRTNLLKLMKGRIDCYLNDRLSIAWELGRIRTDGAADPNAQALVEVAELSAEQGYLGFTTRDPARFPYRDDFIRKFNAVIKAMKHDGEIRETVERFLRAPD